MEQALVCTVEPCRAQLGWWCSRPKPLLKARDEAGLRATTAGAGRENRGLQWDRRIASIENVERAQKPREGRVAGGTVQQQRASRGAARDESDWQARKEARRSTASAGRWASDSAAGLQRSLDRSLALAHDVAGHATRSTSECASQPPQPAGKGSAGDVGALRVIYTGHMGSDIGRVWESAGACGLPAKTTRGTEPHATRQRLIDGRVLSAHHSGDDLGPRDKPSPSPAAPHTVVVVCRGGRAHIRCRRRRMRKEARALAVSRNPSRPTLLAVHPRPTTQIVIVIARSPLQPALPSFASATHRRPFTRPSPHHSELSLFISCTGTPWSRSPTPLV